MLQTTKPFHVLTNDYEAVVEILNRLLRLQHKNEVAVTAFTVEIVETGLRFEDVLKDTDGG